MKCCNFENYNTKQLNAANAARIQPQWMKLKKKRDKCQMFTNILVV